MLKKPEASFWVRSVFYTLLQRASLFIFGVVSYMILVRGFSTVTNGVWALYITIFSIFEAVKQGLLRNATIKFLGMKEYERKQNEVQSASLLVNIFFSVLVILIILVGNTTIEQTLQSRALADLLLWSIMIIVLLIPYNHCEILMQAGFHFDTLFKAAFLRQGIFFTGIILMYFLLEESFTLHSILILQVVALAVSFFYILVKSRYDIKLPIVLSTGLAQKLFHFGKYTFGTNLFSGLSRSLDHFATAGTLGSVDGKNYVAYYNTVARVNNMVDVPSLAAADVLFPKNVEAMEKEGLNKVKYYFEHVIAIILAIIVPASLLIFVIPGTIIEIIAGEEYEPAISILQLTILFSIVRPLSYQFGSTLDAIGRPDVNFWVNAGLMFISLPLNLVFLHVFGGMGPAYATMIYYVISLCVMLLVLKKHIDIDFGNIVKYAIDSYRSALKLF